MKIVASLLLCLVLSLAGGCGDGSPPRRSSTGDLRINNFSSRTISEVNLVPLTDPDWNGNLLSTGLPPGYFVDIVNILPGTYDARSIVDSPVSTYYCYLFDIPIHAGVLARVDVEDFCFTGSLEVVNASLNRRIFGLFAAPVGSVDWGPNLITLALQPADLVHFTDLDPDLYDVRVVWDAGPESIYRRVSIDSLFTTTLSVQ